MSPQRSKSAKPVYRTIEFKLYLNQTQEQTLTDWLGNCCWIYNQALEQRKKVYERWKSDPSRERKNVSQFDQIKLLTLWRSRIPEFKAVPVEFQRSALRRLDGAFQAFFKRVKAGQNPGYPRFQSRRSYASMETLVDVAYICPGCVIVPKLGRVRARGPFHLVITKPQPLLRIIRRASGWYAQTLVPAVRTVTVTTGQSAGIDLGLTSLVVTDSGQKYGNPRILKRAARRLRAAQKTLSRRKKGSRRRHKAKQKVGWIYERLRRQRRGLAHQISRDLVNRYDKIAHEDLNIKGLCKGKLRKSVLDAAWAQLLRYLTYKAANAGKIMVAADPRFTSQTCPSCQAVAPKKLSDRVHACPCGCVLDRDVAAAMVIRQRGFSPVRGGPVRPGAILAGPKKR